MVYCSHGTDKRNGVNPIVPIAARCPWPLDAMEVVVMTVVVDGCAGLDVHRGTVVACVRTPGPNRQRVSQIRTFGTTTVELLAALWLSVPTLREVVPSLGDGRRPGTVIVFVAFVSHGRGSLSASYWVDLCA